MIERAKIESALQDESQSSVTDRVDAVYHSTDRLAAARRHEAQEGTYHQARLLLLIGALAGESGSLDGLTKLAKTDFLLRYPVFLQQLSSAIGAAPLPDNTVPDEYERNAVESRMIRYKYGPWDDKYYSILGGLVGRGLIEMVPKGSTFGVRLTPGGASIVAVLRRDPAWAVVDARCKYIKENFGRFSGNRIKDLIYTNLPNVIDRAYRKEI